jgi:hypothetical protein
MNMEIQAALDVADETDAFLQITDVIFDREAEIGYDDLSRAEKTVYCIDSLSREMENGGFGQLFHHDAGALCTDMLEALEQIRAKNTLLVVQQMVNFFPNGEVPSDEEERMDTFDQLASELVDEIAECDDRFHDAGENLIELTLKFVAKNIAQFR